MGINYRETTTIFWDKKDNYTFIDAGKELVVFSGFSNIFCAILG
jgi:hypothetical protein